MAAGAKPQPEGSEQRRVRVFQRQPIKPPPGQPMPPPPAMPPQMPAQRVSPPVPAQHMPPPMPAQHAPQMAPPMPGPYAPPAGPYAPPPAPYAPPPHQGMPPMQPPAPQAPPAPNPRHQEVERLRQQHGSCIWRVWTRVESSPRLAFAPVYLQVDAEDQDDGTTIIRQYGRSWVFPTAVVDAEVLGIERAIEERWINREEFRAFLFE